MFAYKLIIIQGWSFGFEGFLHLVFYNLPLPNELGKRLANSILWASCFVCLNNLIPGFRVKKRFYKKYVFAR